MTQQVLIQNKDYLNHPVDKGCESATNYLKEQSLCTGCPFELCIKDIKYSTRLLLQSNDTIKQVYEAYGQGLTIEKVSKVFNNLTLSTIQYWIKHRNRIRTLLNKYSWAVPYLILPHA